MVRSFAAIAINDQIITKKTMNYCTPFKILQNLNGHYMNFKQ